MGGSTKTSENSQQQATQSNTVDPQQMAMLQGNYAGAQTRANSLTPYTGQMVAGFNPTQTQAQGILTSIGTDPRYSATAQGAVQGAQGVLDANIGGTITPQVATASLVGAPTPVSAGMLSATDLSRYMNPYTNDVINTTLSANERARQMANVNDNQAATASHAFGGSRSGVANALTNEAYDRNNLSTIAGLNSDNFNQATANATNDLNRQYGADTYNATNNLNVGTTNAAAQNNMSQFNTSNNIAAQQNSFTNALAAQGLKLNAAGQIEALNNDALGTATGQAGVLGAVGDAQQQQQQAQLTAAYQAYMDGQQLTVEQQQLLNSALGLVPVQQTVSSNGTSSGTSVQKTNPGIGGILSSLGSLAQGAAAFSDIRTKADIKTIGHDMRGRRWVEFRYKWEGPEVRHVGLIAQEILHSDPDAVHMGDDGLYRVDYSKLETTH